VSVPLGAGEVTRSHLPDDPPRSHQVKELHRHVKQTIGELADRLRWEGVPGCVVGTSKTFKQLARLTGAPRQRKGPFVHRYVRRPDLHRCVQRMATMNRSERAALPGIAKSRARQILAGAVVAESTMRLLDIDVVSVCPWALREGIVLRKLDRLERPDLQHDAAVIDNATAR